MSHTAKLIHRDQSSVLKRSGLSIMEVLFAIGVLTIGLMGVAFMLPVATNNASSSLRDDRTAEELNNAIAKEIASLGKGITHLVGAENSKNTPAFFTASPRPTDAGFDTTGQRFFDIPVSQLPSAFCIDPWFLNAANCLRNNVSSAAVNGYDRTFFPCYDRNYVPSVSPADPIANSLAGAMEWTWKGRNLKWNTPRFTRVALPADMPNATSGLAMSRSTATSDDDFSVVVNKDSTVGAGLFLQRSGHSELTRMRSLTRPTETGRFSSMVMMSRAGAQSSVYNAAVVTMQDRDVVILPREGVSATGDDMKHQLAPYAHTTAGPNGGRILDEHRLYDAEVMGYVTYAPRPFVRSNGGEFIFRTSQFTKPDVKEGGWVCLIRQEYPMDSYPASPPSTEYRSELLTPTGRYPVFDSAPRGQLHFNWYRITAVVSGPNLDTNLGVYDTQIAVRGPDWVFHPSQTQVPSGGGGTMYGPPYPAAGVTPTVSAADPLVYDFSGTGHPDFGTIVVVMPDVISVSQFLFEFE
ncbi:hypothetical protein [Rhodopirellula sp. MGV]|uniref:type IV pilus modification PilV family protein n=1 Tax=Rhodopirellula sp. MGV TaxID=2023130 RepID=UPI000B964D97|nr:hypothetical protein [Rhodopirellula sp. MGV]OYP32177.1 hypothetical protein CGZ80_20490 [Rhodopirellula sp. MGV]PNY35185.1 hypothetical protein C2E31_20030 [Rhodopirellula baltica]